LTTQLPDFGERIQIKAHKSPESGAAPRAAPLPEPRWKILDPLDAALSLKNKSLGKGLVTPYRRCGVLSLRESKEGMK
jgi:hypothetical protein